MKKLIVLFLAALFSANQAFAASASGSSNVKVVTVLQITAGTALSFGSIATTGTAGTITINSTNTTGIVAPANSIALVSNAASRTAGTFSVSNGEASASYTVTLPSTVTLTSGSDNITVDGFNFIAGNGARSLSASGTDTFSVGAVLHVGASQNPGTYTAGVSSGYTVTANY